MKVALALLALALAAPVTIAVEDSTEAPTAAWRTVSGVVRDGYGLIAPPATGTPESIAHRYLSEHAEELGIPSVEDLVPTSVRRSLTATHFRFLQTWDGVPVSGSEVSVHVRNDGAIVAVHSRAVGSVRAGAEIVSESQAVEIASSAAKGEFVSAIPVFLARELRGVSVWRVSFEQAAPPSRVVAYVDRHTGELLGAYDYVFAADAKANVWINPIVVSRNPDLRDNRAGLENDPTGTGYIVPVDLSQYYTEATVPNLAEGPAGPVLEGPAGKVMDATAMGADLRFSRLDPRFEEVQSYYWIDWSRAEIQALGFEDVMNYQLPIFTKMLTGVFNAFYLGELGQLGVVPAGQGLVSFGYHAPVVTVVSGGPPRLAGFADAGEDAEVILHEYGHAILDNQVPGFGFETDEGGAMHEGWGDFWAATQLSRLSEGAWDYCVGEWFTSYLTPVRNQRPPCLRTLENDMTAEYEQPPAPAQRPDPHLPGQIWAGALWTIWKSAGREETERLALEANFLLPVDGGYADGGDALLTADLSLNGGANAKVIADEFARRKVELDLTSEIVEAIRSAEQALEQTSVPQQESSAARTTPGIEAIAAVGALGTLALARRRR